MAAPSSARPLPLHPVLAALAAAPLAEPDEFTEEDRAICDAHRRAGNPGISQAEVTALLEERRRRGT